MIIFSNRVYDRLKFLVLVVLPMIGTLYYFLSLAWDIPFPNTVVGVVVVVDAYLGIALYIASIGYERHFRRDAGVMEIEETDEKLNYLLALSIDPMELKDAEELIFKVHKSE